MACCELSAERIREVELRRPPREVRGEQRRQRVGITARDAADRRAVDADASAVEMQLAAADADEAVRADEVRLRLQSGRPEYFSVTLFASTFFFAISRSVRSLSARRTAASTSIGSGRKSGRSTGSSRAFQFGSCVPATISRLSVNSFVRIADCAATRFCRCRGRLRLRGDDVDRRHRADLDARLVVLHELVARLTDCCATSTDCTVKT